MTRDDGRLGNLIQGRRWLATETFKKPPFDIGNIGGSLAKEGGWRTPESFGVSIEYFADSELSRKLSRLDELFGSVKLNRPVATIAEEKHAAREAIAAAAGRKAQR